MLTRIELKNFMSHAHTVIEPAAGLTVLIGPNNVGKSAIVAALQILCSNDNSTYVMRHGKKFCAVIVETDDGHTIEWRRKTSPSYVIDGQKFDRLGRDIPEELHEALRLGKVEGHGKDEFDVHFGSQKSPIFLLDSSGTTAARFFASSSDAIRLVEMQQRHKERIRDARKEKTRLEARSAQVNRELECLQPIVDIEPRITALEKLYADVNDQTATIANLTETASTLAEQREVVAYYRDETKAIAELEEPPKIDDVSPLAESIHNLSELGRDVTYGNRVAEVVGLLSPVPEWHDTQSLADWINARRREQKTIAQAESQLDVIRRATSPPKLEDVGSLESLIADLELASREYSMNARLAADLGPLSEPPTQADWRPLIQLCGQIEAAARDVSHWDFAWHCLEQAEPMEFETAQPLVELIKERQELDQEVQRQERLFVAMKPLSEPEAPLKTEPLAELIKQLTEEIATAGKCENAVNEAELAMQQVRDSLSKRAAEETCPLCGGPIDIDRLLEHSAHAGEESS